MFIYIAVFILSLLFTRLCETTKKSPVRVFSGVMAVLIPAIVAGIRDPGIGHDTLIYVDDTFEEVVYYRDLDFFVFFKDLIVGEFTQERFYCFLNYLGVLLGNDVHYVYFVVSLFTIGFAFKAIYDFRAKASLTLMMLFFLLLFYNISYNTIRQCVALMIALNIYNALEKKMWYCFGGLFILFLLSHTTSIVFFLFLFLYFIQKKEYGKYLVPMLLIAVPLALLMLDEIILLAISMGVVPKKMMIYMASETGEAAVMKTAVAYGWIVLIIMLMMRNFIGRAYRKEIYFYIIVRLFANLLLLASVQSLWAFRMSYYFSVFDILFLPRMMSLVPLKSKQMAFVFNSTLIILISFYWYWSIIHNNENETYPYQSKILSELIML